MIPFILGILSALVQTSFFGALAPTSWHILSSVAVIIYLYRFGLRHISHTTSWWIGLILDLLSSWPFGVWLVIILLVDLIADMTLPKQKSSTAESAGALLVFSLSLIICIGVNLANHGAWLGGSVASAIIVTLLYYIATRATLVWRIYE